MIWNLIIVLGGYGLIVRYQTSIEQDALEVSVHYLPQRFPFVELMLLRDIGVELSMTLRRRGTSKITQDRLLRSRLGGLGILGILVDDGG